MPEEIEDIEPVETTDNLETSQEVPEEPAYTVKVDGEEAQVSLEELQNGYQRQADYTRKTQEIAAERERLQQAERIVSALEADPEATLHTLARSFNVELNEQNVVQQVQQTEEWESMDDTERKVLMLEQRLAEQDKKFAAQEQAQKVQKLEQEVIKLKDTYGEFDQNELVNHAIKHQIPNLEAAYAHWRFNDVKSIADKLSQEQEITSKKREASVVTSGSSASKSTSGESTKEVSSLREAFALAKEQLNL